MTSKLLGTFRSEYTSDVVEWDPIDTSRCILATYYLQKDKGTRCGSIEGFKKIQNPESNEMSLERTFELPVDFGVFDVKFRSKIALMKSYESSDHPSVGEFMAVGSGKSVLYRQTSLDTESSCTAQKPEEIASFVLEDESVMCTSVDFNDKLISVPSSAFVSMSSGELAILDLERGGSRIETVKQWNAHDLEAWIVACNHFEPDVFYSGGDDAMFKGWDTRMDGPTFRVKTHRAGVCSIQKHPLDEFKLATGSYDSNVYLWDTRAMGRPLDKYDTEGGVWRVKWNPVRPDLLMLACMRTSFQFFRVTEEDKLEHLHTATIEDGENLAYGCDWCYEDAGDKTFHFASCSFYNNELQWWEVSLESQDVEGSPTQD